MSELGTVEEYPDFLSASQRAKELAAQFKENTGIQRTETGWGVLASNFVSAVLESHDGEDYSCNSFDEEYQREVVQPIIEEMQNDQDSWARSDEEGWFYE